MKLIHSSVSAKSALVSVYLFQDSYSEGWSPVYKFFSWATKIIFLRQENIFRGSEKKLEEREKCNFVRKTLVT